MSTTDTPDVAAAKRLLDAAKDAGFTFQRIAPGEDGPLIGRRDTTEYRDQIYLARSFLILDVWGSSDLGFRC